jgi:hypothetical protein
MHLVIFLRTELVQDSIKKIVSKVLSDKPENVGHFKDEDFYPIKYELRILDDISEFKVELNIFADKSFEGDFCLESFAVDFSHISGLDVVIASQNNNPYEWVLRACLNFYFLKTNNL